MLRPYIVDIDGITAIGAIVDIDDITAHVARRCRSSWIVGVVAFGVAGARIARRGRSARADTPIRPYVVVFVGFIACVARHGGSLWADTPIRPYIIGSIVIMAARVARHGGSLWADTPIRPYIMDLIAIAARVVPLLPSLRRSGFNPHILRERPHIPRCVHQLQHPRHDEGDVVRAEGAGREDWELFEYEVTKRYTTNLLPNNVIKDKTVQSGK